MHADLEEPLVYADSSVDRSRPTHYDLTVPPIYPSMRPCAYKYFSPAETPRYRADKHSYHQL
jgi:hypothetical protein